MKQRKRSVVLGITGSIAAYKAAELASLLVKQGHDVSVVMTRDATEFITPLTLQTLSKNPVTTSFYDEKQSWHPGHIALADRANLLVIAPARSMAKIIIFFPGRIFSRASKPESSWSKRRSMESITARCVSRS